MVKKKTSKKLFSHHRHTGKVLPRQHTSYPLIVLVLLMVGVLLGHVTMQARAADVVVTATANGPLPPSAAVILSPKDGDRFTDFPIAVSGTCPAPYFVKLYRNQAFSGSTQCNNDGTFLIYTDLFVGKNELEVRVVNAADQEGPRSNVVTVYFDQPITQAPPGSPSAPSSTPERESSAGEPKPFLITSDIFFKAIYDNDEVTWKFGIVGGRAPFHITVAWGDGSTSTLSRVGENEFTVTHKYRRGAQAREYYPVAVSVTDSDGRKASLQVFTILNNRLIPGLGSTSEDNQPLSGSALLQRVALSAYGVTTLMAISFWLGERHELMSLSRHLGQRFKHRKV